MNPTQTTTQTTPAPGTQRPDPATEPDPPQDAVPVSPVPTAVDPAAIVALLDGRWADVRAAARRDLPSSIFDPTDHLSTEEQRAWVLERAHELAATGQPHRSFDVRHGGADDQGGSVVAFEMLGHGDLSLTIKAGVQWGLFGGALHSLGSPEQRDRWIPDAMSLQTPGCFAMTETGHGSDVASLGTTATYDPATGEFVVNTPDDTARKDYIGGAARDARLAVVFAQLITGEECHGVHCLVVPIREADGSPCAGVRIEDCGRKEGLNGVDNGRLWFDHVRIPRTNLLSRYGSVAQDGTYSSPIAAPTRRFFTMLGALVRGRASIAGGAGAATRMALTTAVRYAERRRQFPRPGGGEVVLMDYRTHQRRLLPAIATSYALAFAQEQLVVDLQDIHEANGTPESGATQEDPRQRELEARAAGIKAVSTWHASRTITQCRESCGGAGYLSENRLAQLRADIDVFTTFEGDNVVLLQLLAKSLLTRYRGHVEDLDTLGMVRLVAGQVVDAVAERTSARSVLQRLTPGRDEMAIRDRVWQRAMLAERERHVLATLARRLRRPGQDSFTTFNEAQEHVVAAAVAHVDRIVLDTFAAKLQGCTDPAARELLDRVCDLYALHTIERDRGWFLEHERLTPSRSKAVGQAIDELCRRLRPHAETLVAGFGIPQEWITAPIARDPA